jgi:hypothetical protein
MLKIIFLSLCPFFLLLADPLWLTDPTMGGKYVAGIGCSKKQKNKIIQEQIAKLRAEAEISASKDVSVNDEIDSFSDGFDSEFRTYSKQNSNTLVTTYIKDKFIDKDGNLCVWLVESK